MVLDAARFLSDRPHGRSGMPEALSYQDPEKKSLRRWIKSPLGIYVSPDLLLPRFSLVNIRDPRRQGHSAKTKRD